MNFNWPIISNKLFGIIKGSCKNITMYDAKGNETIDPDDATRFFANFKSDAPKLDTFTVLVAIHDEGQSSFIVIKTPVLDENDVDFDKIHMLRNHIKRAVGQKEGIKINWQVFDHAIDPREEAVNNIKESKDVGKVFGTTKSSFQRIGEAKLIIRHTDTVNEEKHGSRTRHIKSIFVENKLGERFSFPYPHLTGGRAFARHISNGGTNHDAIAESIFDLSEKYLQLRRSSTMLRRTGSQLLEYTMPIKQGMNSINKKLKSLHGPKGYSTAISTLTESPAVIDERAIAEIQLKLAETCGCQQGEQGWDDLGTAARYITLTPVSLDTPSNSFSWNARPNIDSSSDQFGSVMERLSWQLSEIAKACSDINSADRLSEISNMLRGGQRPTDEDLDFVREAFNSSQSYVPVETGIIEEVELDNWLLEYSPEKIFAEDEPAKISCSNCGAEFATNGRTHGFSHCKDHKGYKPLYEIGGYSDDDDDYDGESKLDLDYGDDDLDFADPHGNSALRAASHNDPRNLPCPTCGHPNMLTRADAARGYQCDSCADAAERGGEINYYSDSNNDGYNEMEESSELARLLNLSGIK